jgi:hypothetical protein
MAKIPVKRRGRPAKIDTMIQTREVASFLLLAKPRSEIIDHCVNTYGVQETSVGAIITRAYAYIKDTHAVDRDGLVTTHIQHYYEIYNVAKSLGDSRGAIQALNSIEKLLKLTNDPLIQNNSLTFNLKDLSVNELKDLLKVKIN